MKRHKRVVPTITTVGEALIDFVSTKPATLEQAPAFVKAVGGEGANVAVGLAKLGSHSTFIGKVGDDSFGKFLLNALTQHGVETKHLIIDTNHKTRLAFVSLEESGERDFEFWEKIPAGEQLRFSDIRLSVLKRSHIVNIAPLLLMHEPARATAFRVARVVRRHRGQIAFDANVRLALWTSAAMAKRVMLKMARHSTILRLNDDEAKFLTGVPDVEKAARKLRSLGPNLVAVTLGAKGCYFQTSRTAGVVEGFAVDAVDTTGCGDAFFAALLHGLAHAHNTLDDLTHEELRSICTYANAVGALTSLKRGGAEGVPHSVDVIRFLRKHG